MRQSIKYVALVCLLGWQYYSLAQNIDLTSLDFFSPPKSNWSIQGDVSLDPTDFKKFKTSPGNGILVNQPNVDQSNIFTVTEHGDLDLELEFMTAMGSNSGIYLQGRYEIQLYDSWGKRNPAFFDCGGIYQRWDDSAPEGENGYEGYAPRQGVSIAPGLWQKLSISFQAPKFSKDGEKIENAKIIEIKHNGVIIHQNVELTGPTRGPVFAEEAALGPLMIQGDHGLIAFRNISFKAYTENVLSITNLSYKAYHGDYAWIPDFDTLGAPVHSGEVDLLSWNVSRVNNQFAIDFEGELNVTEPGEYSWFFQSGANGKVYLDGKELFDQRWGAREAKSQLEIGKHKIKVQYAKRASGVSPLLALFVSHNKMRSFPLHEKGSFIMSVPNNPIYYPVSENPQMLRSFVDYTNPNTGDKKRITHALSVGSYSGCHYTMDLSSGNLVKMWIGEFLDVSKMWKGRGDGSSVSRGSVLVFDELPLFVTADGEEVAHKFVKYTVEDENLQYHHNVNGNMVSDLIKPIEGGKKLSRILQFQTNDINVVLSTEKDIVSVSPGLYTLRDKSYYIYTSAQSKIVDKDGISYLIAMPGDQKEVYYEIIR